MREPKFSQALLSFHLSFHQCNLGAARLDFDFRTGNHLAQRFGGIFRQIKFLLFQQFGHLAFEAPAKLVVFGGQHQNLRSLHSVQIFDGFQSIEGERCVGIHQRDALEFARGGAELILHLQHRRVAQTVHRVARRKFEQTPHGLSGSVGFADLQKRRRQSFLREMMTWIELQQRATGFDALVPVLLLQIGLNARAHGFYIS